MTDTDVDRGAVTDAELHPLLAARWSPRGFDPEYRVSDADLNALLEAARWTPSYANSQPWQRVLGAHLSVQATALNLMVHQMAGFDAGGLRAEFSLPDTLKPMAMIAIGRWDPEAPLPDYLREREFAPRQRKPLSELVLPL